MKHKISIFVTFKQPRIVFFPSDFSKILQPITCSFTKKITFVIGVFIGI